MKYTANTKIRFYAFTLIEAIAALSVFGTSAVVVFGVLDVCARATHHNKMLTHAVMLAESKLTETRLREKTAFEEINGEDGLFRWVISIKRVDRIENLAAVRIQVNWIEQNRNQRYELASLLQMKTFN